MALFMIFYKGKHTQLGDNQMGDNQKRGTQKGGTHVANYNIGCLHFELLIDSPPASQEFKAFVSVGQAVTSGEVRTII